MNLLAMMMRLLALGVSERAGDREHPAIQWAHELCKLGERVADEIAWCSSIINLAAALTNRKRSKSAAARSWLNPSLGQLITNRSAFKEMLNLMHSTGEQNAVLVFTRGAGRGMQDASVLDAPGHVAVFASFNLEAEMVQAIGGNQGNTMSLQWHKLENLIGIVIVDSDTLSILNTT